MSDKTKLEKLLNYVKARLLLEKNYRSSRGLLADEYHRGRRVTLESILSKVEQLNIEEESG